MHDFVIELLQQNVVGLILMGGLLIFSYSNRGTALPQHHILQWVVVLAFATMLVRRVGEWAYRQGPGMIPLRFAMSIVEYILVPHLLFLPLLELVRAPKQRWLLAIPQLVNIIIISLAPLAQGLVFWFDAEGRYQRGPLGATTYFIAFFYLFAMLTACLRYFRHSRRRVRVIIGYTVFITLAAAVLEFADVSGVLDNVIFIDIFFYYVFVSDVFREEVVNRLVQRELELSQSRVRLMQEQIQPHFIFNSLYVIKALIRRDPDKAVEAVENFSDYLRSNIDALRSERLISFEKELEHIEAYVALEHADETRHVEVRYDLEETDFRLPALSVEPIVENAIRHGLASCKEGGLVEIATRREGDAVLIRVRDNGVGFDAAPERWQKNASVGIRNVRTRLEEQCGGTLELSSGPEGTTAEIRIPLKQADAAGEESK